MIEFQFRGRRYYARSRQRNKAGYEDKRSRRRQSLRHGFFSSQSFWKRGSPRKESHFGSSLKSAGVRQLLYGISNRRCSLGIARLLSPTIASTNAKFSSYEGPSTASFPLGSNVIARSASFIAASFSPSTARISESACAKFGLSGSFWLSGSSRRSICRAVALAPTISPAFSWARTRKNGLKSLSMSETSRYSVSRL